MSQRSQDQRGIATLADPSPVRPAFDTAPNMFRPNIAEAVATAPESAPITPHIPTSWPVRNRLRIGCARPEVARFEAHRRMRETVHFTARSIVELLRGQRGREFPGRDRAGCGRHMSIELGPRDAPRDASWSASYSAGASLPIRSRPSRETLVGRQRHDLDRVSIRVARIERRILRGRKRDVEKRKWRVKVGVEGGQIAIEIKTRMDPEVRGIPCRRRGRKRQARVETQMSARCRKTSSPRGDVLRLPGAPSPNSRSIVVRIPASLTMAFALEFAAIRSCEPRRRACRR